MSCPILPKGFTDCSGYYMAKTKPIFKALLNPEEVEGWKAMLNTRLVNADKYELKVINKELCKLERVNG
jgi:hypothetical protein